MSITASQTIVARDDASAAISAEHAATGVRKASADETAHLARALARAFEDDPVSAWFFPDESDRVERLERMYRLIFVPDHVRYGEAYTVGDHAGVALWTPPGEGKLSPMATLRLMPTMRASSAVGRRGRCAGSPIRSPSTPSVRTTTSCSSAWSPSTRVRASVASSCVRS